MARALRLNPVAIRRAIYADGWLGGYRRAVRRALDVQVRRVAARALAGEQVVIDDAEVERWAAELDRAKRDRVHAMVRDGFSLAGREFPVPAKALGRSPGPDQPMSIAVGEGEEFLIRADFKDVDQWVETTSLSESRTSAKKLERIFTQASRTVKKDAEGRVRGTTPREIAKAILRKGLTDDRARADMLARTGTIWAFNEGAQQRYKAEGVTVEEWMVTVDDVTCQYCMRMDGRRVRVDESFMSAGESMTTESPTGKPQTLSMPFDVQHPPLHPRCRCTMVPVLPELPREVVAPTEIKPPEVSVVRKPEEGLIDLSSESGAQGSAIHNKWVKSLTDNEKESIEFWTQGGSVDIRARQAGVKIAPKYVPIPTKKVERLTKAFESAVKRAPKVEGEVYRGLRGLSDGTYDSLISAEQISFNAHSSAAIEKKLGMDFAIKDPFEAGKRILLTVEQKSAVELFETEILRTYKAREVILQRNVKYRVIGRKEVTITHPISLEKLQVTELSLKEI